MKRRVSLLFRLFAVLSLNAIGTRSFCPTVGNNAKKNCKTPSSSSKPAIGVVSKRAPNKNDNIATTLLSASRSSSGDKNKVDAGALAKYGIALATQMGLIFGFFSVLDAVVSATETEIPFAATGALFYALALKSRVFNPLSNSRPRRDNNMEAEEITAEPPRNQPSWQPPGVVFPIMWVLVIGPLRAYTSAMVYDANGGVFADAAILSLMLHLSIGDVWNTINNVERRYGTAVVGVACVWLSAANAAYRYSLVSPEAGKLLGLSLVWLTVASALIADTWRVNPTDDDGTLDSFLPLLGDDGASKTKLVWLEK